MAGARRLWPWPPRRLSTRIAGISLALLLLVQGAGFVAIRASVDRNARQSLADELTVGERVWHRLLEQKSDSLVQGARVLAADYGFRSALGPDGDTATLASALENAGDRIGAGVTAWVDATGHVRAVHHAADAADGHGGAMTTTGHDELAALAAALAQSRQDRRIALVEGRPLQMVAVPVRAPTLLGWVVLGFPIDQALVDDMHALSGLQVALIGSAAGRAQVVASTLPPASLPALLAASQRASETADVAGETLLLRRVPLMDVREAPAAGPVAHGAQLLLLRSVDEAVARYRQLLWLLGAITFAGVGVFAFGSVITARKVTTPLRALARASLRLGRGDYDTDSGVDPLDRRRADEVGELARAFDRMRLNLAGHEQEIRQLAFWDRLTGLPNRAQFRDAVAAAIEASAQAAAASGEAARPLAVVMLDLDRFKHVNDVLGYAFGDQLLKAVAGRLSQQMVREEDLVARFSGDEFALLLPGSDCQQALAVAQRIARAFEQPLTLDEQTVDLAAGFGVACWPAHAGDVDTLISHAEIAMYTAKSKTEPALVYDPAIDASSAQTLSLLSELRQAIERGELRLYLQPKIDLAGDRLRSAEALVRWQHPQRGLVPPMEFIPFAEQTGFVRRMTLWIFEEAARQWPALRSVGLERISINLSMRDLLDTELPQRFDAILRRHGVLASAFCLEITESAIMDEPTRSLAMLQTLAQAGFKLSIDDYGEGQTSLSYLKRLPVHELKIDQIFIKQIDRDEKDAKIVRSTIGLAHSLGFRVVAEGVESGPVMEQLRGLGCDEVQGYFISRPLPAADLPAFAARWAERLAQQAAESAA